MKFCPNKYFIVQFPQLNLFLIMVLMAYRHFLKCALLILKINKENESEFIVEIPLFSCAFDLLFIGYS